MLLYKGAEITVLAVLHHDKELRGVFLHDAVQVPNDKRMAKFSDDVHLTSSAKKEELSTDLSHIAQPTLQVRQLGANSRLTSETTSNFSFSLICP